MDLGNWERRGPHKFRQLVAASCAKGQEADLELLTPTGGGPSRTVLMESGLELWHREVLLGDTFGPHKVPSLSDITRLSFCLEPPGLEVRPCSGSPAGLRLCSYLQVQLLSSGHTLPFHSFIFIYFLLLINFLIEGQLLYRILLFSIKQ